MQHNSQRRPLRHKLDVQALFNITIENLYTCFAKVVPDATQQRFVAEILERVNACDHPGIDDPVGILKLVASEYDLQKGDEWIATSPIGTIIVSCAYALRASRAQRHGDVEIAWSYMADARFWSGAAIADKGIGEVIEQTRASTRVDSAKLGNDGRNRAYNIYRRMAWRLVRQKRPQQRGWQSVRHAAETIRKPFLQFVEAVASANARREERNKTLPRGQAKKLVVIPKTATIERRLRDWFAEMPDRGQLFPPAKTGRPKSKKTVS
ncbi:hypothetical protein CIC12_10630 [Burkholderia sp. SG-MS1]|nr:hypothetical protein [Paraburkholderia sp. SG-MS1]